MNENHVTGPFAWVWDEQALGQLKEAIYAAHEVVWDTETTGLASHAVEGGTLNNGIGARQALATFTLPQADAQGLWNGVEPTTWIVPLSHPDSPFLGRWRKISAELMELILKLKKPLVGHNLKYDVRYQEATTGVNLVSVIDWDTQDGSRLLDNGQSAKLGDAAHRAFGVPSWKDFEFSKIPGAAEGVPIFELGEYGARDTYWTWRLKRYQQEQMFLVPGMDEPFDSDEIMNMRLGKLATWVAMPTVASLAQIEINGIRLDVQTTRDMLAESKQISRDALHKMALRYLPDFQAGRVDLKPDSVSAAPTSLWFARFSKWAVEKGDMKVLELTPTGKMKWTKTGLAKLAKQYGPDSVPAIILEQRHHSKRAEFLTAWLHYVTEAGFIHAQYNTGMVTGRLSSSVPNMQQVNKKLRPCFIPHSDEWVVADFDFSQIELRVAAFISRSLPMLEAFRRGEDLHRALAALVTGKEPHEVTAEERQMAKAVNFGLLFGLGAYGLTIYAEESYGVTMTKDQASTFYHAYFRKWVGLKAWHAQVQARLERDNCSVSPLGRIRNFKGRGDKDLNAAINAPVQGMASDLMQIAIADIQGLLPAGQGRGKVEDVLVIGTVHDSAVVLLPKNNWEAKAKEVQQRMEDLNPLLKFLGIELDVPIKIEATVGSRWSLDDIGTIS